MPSLPEGFVIVYKDKCCRATRILYEQIYLRKRPTMLLYMDFDKETGLPNLYYDLFTLRYRRSVTKLF